MGAFRGSGSADSNAAASAEFDAWLFETCTKVTYFVLSTPVVFYFP